MLEGLPEYFDLKDALEHNRERSRSRSKNDAMRGEGVDGTECCGG